MSPKTGLVKDEDPETAAMSLAELRKIALAAFGSWADRDDIGDDWLENIRSSWDDRLDELYNDTPDSV